MKKYLSIFCLAALTLSMGQEKWDLRECVDYAVQHNLTVNQSKIYYELSTKELESANKQWLPTVNAYLDNSLTIGSHHPLIDKAYQQYSNSLGLSSSIAIYNGGLIELNKERAELNVQANELQTASIANDISLMVVNYYLNVMLNRELLQIAQGNLEVSEEQLNRAQILYDGGRISRADLVQAEAAVAQEKKNVSDAQIEVERALFNLSTLLQLPDYRNFDVEDISLPDDLQFGVFDLDEILQIAYQEQPNVKRAELDVEIATKDIDIAKTSLKPTITGTYNLGTSYADYFNKGLVNDAWLTQWYENIANVFGISVQIPIFDRHQTKLNVEKATINQSLAQNLVEQEKQKLKENIQEAYFHATTSYDAYRAARESVRSSELSTDFAQRSFDAGVLNIYDLQIARNNLMIAKAQMAQAKFNFVFRLKVLDFYAGIPLTEGLGE